MEVEFRKKNRRELEVQEDLSLLQLAPAALVMLRTQGRCEVLIEESALDQRTPGHYFRPLKNFGVSIPYLTGPHTRAHCTLRLVKSNIRVQSGLRNGRYEQDVNDVRFRELSGIEAAVVTSGAQKDDGLFAGGTGDERHLLFEGHGAISMWQLELPEKVQQFDYSTMSNVVLHMQYTAREGIPMHVATDAAMARLKAKETFRMSSMRHAFPNAWAALGIAEDTSDFVSAEVALRRCGASIFHTGRRSFRA